MKCPKCKGKTVTVKTHVLIDNIVKRVRKCTECNYTFETCEFNADDAVVKELLEEREHKYASNSLCWECRRATGFCSWSREFEPVQGWQAEKTIVKTQTGTMESYEVKQCPLFEKDKRS